MALAALTCAFTGATCRGTVIYSSSDEAIHHHTTRTPSGSQGGRLMTWLFPWRSMLA